jgi:hypothetical protein
MPWLDARIVAAVAIVTLVRRLQGPHLAGLGAWLLDLRGNDKGTEGAADRYYQQQNGPPTATTSSRMGNSRYVRMCLITYILLTRGWRGLGCVASPKYQLESTAEARSRL